MNERTKEELSKLCNIFRFIDDLNSVNDGREFESSHTLISILRNYS